MKGKKYLLYISMLCVMFIMGCGNSEAGKESIVSTQEMEETQETETEFRIEIIDAADILSKTWEEYKVEERFDIMGGHFTSAVMGSPAKYDLTQTIDLMQMYCVPESELLLLDDVATMVDLYNAGRFTVGAFHISDVENVERVVTGIQNQVLANQWHGETPEKLIIIEMDRQYVVSVYGREPLVNQFKQKLESVYQKMIRVMVDEKIF